ncbi:hypothetical protein Amsp01_043140 [Amycolatopsis sp. NBRC 101858]|uniref:hypothetical protein n=1 Tax=Amycolatopsis sp. NBRC 101858 TaxID=3032200 RepID=UPI0024A4CF97|nr:hypothetical protein [Amycolatopsis sp. NBRC 101858]GLY38290.1 hypothetical protein Amsp01_043140 [Amycolatopsis sp. NBRC 101858]
MAGTAKPGWNLIEYEDTGMRWTWTCSTRGAVRKQGEEPVEQTWVPLGVSPGLADDEVLIDTWHAALQWRQACV